MEDFDADEWNIHDSLVLVTRCEQCGEIKPCELLEDPFIAQIYPDSEHSEEYWCKNCYQHRVMDI